MLDCEVPSHCCTRRRSLEQALLAFAAQGVSSMENLQMILNISRYVAQKAAWIKHAIARILCSCQITLEELLANHCRWQKQKTNSFEWILRVARKKFNIVQIVQWMGLFVLTRPLRCVPRRIMQHHMSMFARLTPHRPICMKMYEVWQWTVIDSKYD